MRQNLISKISCVISDATQRPFEIAGSASVGGGSVNESSCIEGKDGSRYFVKLNDARHHTMFAAETAGLDIIAATNTLRVPRPVAHGIAGERSYLVLEFLELNSRGNGGLLGEQLAALHRNNEARFGFKQNNFIGTTPQPNGWLASWIDFWRERRMRYQLQLSAENGCVGQLQSLGEKLLGDLPAFFNGYTPQPSLLHGDLWSGNHAFLADGSPAVFDPAAYYGDRECDLAMTELFGGYPADFYAAYRACWPLDPGYATRRNLYNLYHILNHANLFGGGYTRQAEQMMQSLLAEIH